MSIISPPQMSREPRARLRTKQEPRTVLQNVGLFRVSVAERLGCRRGRGRRGKQRRRTAPPIQGALGPRGGAPPTLQLLPGLPRASVVKHLPANAEDMCASLYLRRSHMPQSSRDCAPQLLSLCSEAQELQLPSAGTTATEAIAP